MTDFVKTTWVDENEPDITASQLNRMETGIDTAHSEIEAVALQAENAEAAAESAVAIVNAHLADDDAHSGGAGAALPWHNLVELGAVGDDTTYNTTLFQTVLDQIGADGGGTFWLPYSEDGNQYKTHALYVWSNTNILVDPAVVLRCIGQSPSYRNVYNYNEPEAPHPPKYAQALFTLGPMRLIGNNDYSNNVKITGGRYTISDGAQGRLGIGGEGRHVLIEDVQIEGDPFDCLTVSGPGPWYVRRSIFKEGRRNCVSIVADAVDIFFEDCTFSDCKASVGNPEGSPSEQMPGCGVEVEPDFVGAEMRNIHFTRCKAFNNGGAGFGFDLSHNGGLLNCGDIFITDCLAYGNGGNGNALLNGGIHLRGENEDGYPRINISICNFVGRNQNGGAHIQFTPSGCRLDVSIHGCYFYGGTAIGNQGNNSGITNTSNNITL